MEKKALLNLKRSKLASCEMGLKRAREKRDLNEIRKWTDSMVVLRKEIVELREQTV